MGMPLKGHLERLNRLFGGLNRELCLQVPEVRAALERLGLLKTLSN